MYRFQIIARAHMGESIGIVGSTPELGAWDISKCLRLHTNPDRYPVWQTEPIPLWGSYANEFDLPPGSRVEYKYVRFDPKGYWHWEAIGANRWVPIESGAEDTSIVVDDGEFGYLQPDPFGYREREAIASAPSGAAMGLKILVIGSSVAQGQKAWLMEGWAALLARALREKYGHQLVNVSEPGANVSRTIARFGSVVTAEHPDVVIIALSLGNEGLAECAPHLLRPLQRRFESGLKQLIRMTRAIGARPILGGLYPHDKYDRDRYTILQDTHQRMLSWDVPLLDWLGAIDNDRGRWSEGIAFDAAHPNTSGQRSMFEAIDLSLFDIAPAELARSRHRLWQPDEVPIYLDRRNFYVCARPSERRLRVYNPTAMSYTIAPHWQELQTALQHKAKLTPGVYLATTLQPGVPSSLAIDRDGSIAATVEIPAGADCEYRPACELCQPDNPQVSFSDGQLSIVRQDERQLLMVNESDREYSVHPLWSEVRTILKAMPEGVYSDPNAPDTPFRTLIIGANGLESRVKIPPQSAVTFRYRWE